MYLLKHMLIHDNTLNRYWKAFTWQYIESLLKSIYLFKYNQVQNVLYKYIFSAIKISGLLQYYDLNNKAHQIGKLKYICPGNSDNFVWIQAWM